MRFDKLAVLVLDTSLGGICRLSPRGATAGLFGVTGPDAMLKSSFDERLLSINEGDGDKMDLKSCVDHGRRLVETSCEGTTSMSALSGSSLLPFSVSGVVTRVGNCASGCD